MNVSPTSRPTGLDIYRTAVAMRSFEHAAATRNAAESIVVRLRLADGREGYGQTLPREYVTGEDLQSVPADIEQTIWPRLLANWDSLLGGTAADRGAGVLPANIAAIPAAHDSLADIIPASDVSGRCANAAACCVELACLDALAWQEGGAPARAIVSRVSGVLGSANPQKTAKRLRLMRLFGLRDFKLKLGFGDAIDDTNLRIIHDGIGKRLQAGTCSLRVDVNGGWDVASTPERVAALAKHHVCVVEQPVYCSAAELVKLAGRCKLPLMADESLLTLADANVLLSEPRIWWNIRISKNGGLLRAKALANLAAAHGVPYVIGCMVGESGLLSAAQRRLLQLVSPPRFVEGNYGRLLLADDLTEGSPRFGYAGRLKPLRRPGLGISVNPKKLAKYGTLIKTLTA